MRRLPAIALILSLLLPTLADAKATPQQVDAAIKKAIAFLYSKQQEGGNWEVHPQRNPSKEAHEVEGWQWGGLTALTLSSLLYSGENPQNEKIKAGMDWLKNAEVYGVYAMGFRAQVWQYAPGHPGVKQVALRDRNYLLNAVWPEQGKDNFGFYPYYVHPETGKRMRENWYDHSVSQYGVLGMWALNQVPIEVPTQYWQVVDAAWRRHQKPSGGWGYMKANDESVAMTAAGLASLFITQDMLHSMQGLNCTGNIVDPNIAAALKWMNENFKDFEKAHPYYSLYGVERVGVASGYKYFGNLDWYQVGADYLVSRQKPDGSFGNVDDNHNARGIPDTAFSLMFLARGRAPVFANKLDYAVNTAGDRPKPPTWNQRPRDVANIARWTGKQMERVLNWQITNLGAAEADLHDAPILWISGKEALNFKPEEVAKLRKFVEHGGLIVGNSDCATPAFTNSFRKLGTTLFPAYEFRELPETHAIYQQQFRRPFWRQPPFIQGLGNGAREFMLLFPNLDPGKTFQVQNFAGAAEVPAQAMANVFQYSIGGRDPKTKGETYAIEPDAKVRPDKKVKVARIEYAGNWNPEPGGWRRLAAYMRNTHKAELTVETVKLGQGALAKGGFSVAHVTGTTRFKLPPPAQQELKQFVQAGGTLILDATGGAGDFALDGEALLSSLFAPEKLAILAGVHPFFTYDKLEEFEYRPFARKQLGNLKQPRLRAIEFNGKPRVFLSGEDLSVGLVGHSVDGIVGYDPKTTTPLMANVLLNAVLKEPPASRPATRPATPAK